MILATDRRQDREEHRPQQRGPICQTEDDADQRSHARERPDDDDELGRGGLDTGEVEFGGSEQTPSAARDRRVDHGGRLRGDTAEQRDLLDTRRIPSLPRDARRRRRDHEEQQHQSGEDADGDASDEDGRIHRISPNMSRRSVRKSVAGSGIPCSAMRSANRGRTPVGSIRPSRRPSSSNPGE